MNELVRALRERSLSVQERLKVACHLWKHDSDSLPGKEAILLKWTSEEICSAYNKRTRSPPSRDVCSQLWQLLAVEISTLQAHGHDIDEPLSSSSLHLFQSMNEAFSEVVSSSAAEEGRLQCAQNALLSLEHVLTATKLPSILQKFELLVSLLECVMSLALSLLTTGKTFNNLFPVLKMLLKYYFYLQSIQGNQKKVFTTACSQLLEPTLLLLLTATSDAEQNVQEELKLVLQALFSRDHLAEFTSAVSPETEQSLEKKRSATSYARLLFEALQILLAPGGRSQQAVIKSLPMLLEAFLAQNSVEMKVQKRVEFKFFQKMLPLIDVAFSLESDVVDDGLPDVESFAKEFSLHREAKMEDASLVRNLEVLSQCLLLLHRHNVYQLRDDSNEVQFKELQHITLLVLKSTNNSNLDVSFECLATMLNLNHKLVEPVLVLLWFIVLTTEHHTWRNGLVLVEQLIVTYAKLRQVPFLLSQLLEAVKLLQVADTLAVFPALPLSMTELLGCKISELPPGQCVEVLRLLLDHLEDNMDVKSSASSDDMEVDVNALSSLCISTLERAVDICGIALTHLPLSLWSGLHKEDAMDLVVTLNGDVCLLWLEIAFAQEEFDDRMSSACLHFYCICIGLMMHIYELCNMQCPAFFNLNLMRMLKSQTWEELRAYSPKLNCTGMYLLNKLAVLLIRFSPGDPRKERMVDSLLQAERQLSFGNSDSSLWTGQVLDITEANSDVANLTLILSQLPFFYEHCSEANLSNLATAIVTCLLQHREADSEGVWAGEELSVVGVIQGFFNSDAFLEMSKLHELLLERCFTVATSLPKCFAKEVRKEVRKAFRHSTESGSYASSIATLLEYALRVFPEDELNFASYQKKIGNVLQELTIFLKIFRTVPLSSLRLETQQRTLLAVARWHIAIAHLLDSNLDSVFCKAPSVMADLNYLLAWLLHSLSKHLSRASLKRSKRATMFEEVFGSTLDLWLSWLYRTELKSAQLSDVTLSNRVALEIVLNIRLKLQNGRPTDFTIMVFTEWKQCMSSNQSTVTHSIEQCIHIMAKTSCQVCAGLPSSHKHLPDICSYLESLSDLILECLEMVLQQTASNAVLTHPLLVSSYACLLHCKSTPPLSARSLAVMSSLCQSGDCSSGDTAGVDYKSQQLTYKLEAFCGMLDAFSLPAIVAKHPTSSLEESVVPPELHIAASCQRLQLVLTTVFDQLGSASSEADITAKMSSLSLSQPSGTIQLLASPVLAKISQVLVQLLVAANREQIASVIDCIFKQFAQTQSSPVSFKVMFFCWNAIFDAKLAQECRVELRKWLPKVLEECLSKAATSNSLPLAIKLTKKVVALPPQAGVDGASALNTLQLISHVKPSTATTVDVLEASGDLLATVVRQHAAAVDSTPAPVIVVLNKLIKAIIYRGESAEGQSGGLSDASFVHCAEIVSKVMEILSQRRAYCKFVAYPIHEFVSASQHHSLHPAVKKSFLPGVYALLRVCSPPEVAFVKASLDAAGRDTLQALVEDYQKFGKKI